MKNEENRNRIDRIGCRCWGILVLHRMRCGMLNRWDGASP